jgi:hypothetical protein
MPIPVFLSSPSPFNPDQETLLEGIRAQLRDRGLEPRTLGSTDYDYEMPFRAVRRLLREANGVLTVGLRRYWIENGASKPGPSETSMASKWLTSPWPHMETAMGFQLGLPILALREAGVHGDGVLERGMVDIFLPEVDTAHAQQFLASQQWKQPLAHWEANVRTVARNRGTPPALY